MSREIHYSERMGATDALMWNNERDPMLRSTILSVMLLDGPPDEQRFRQAIERALVKVPRLRQHVVLDPLGAAPPRWEVDPHFDLEYHERRLRAPGAGSLRDLLDLAAPIAMQAFDKDRPLWELYRVEGLESGRSALLLKLHHSVSDGVGMVRMTSSLVERTREGRPGRAAPEPSVLEEHAATSAFGEALRALRHRAGENAALGSRALGALRRGAGEALRDPRGGLRRMNEFAGSLGRLLRPVSEPMSPLLRGRSLAIHFDALEVPLDALKRAAKEVGGTLNDAFVAAVLGGLRRYHAHHGIAVEELRMTMPINLRGEDAGGRAGNQFAPARFAVPVGIADAGERMRAIHARVAAQRKEPALALTEDVSAILLRLPRVLAVDLFGSMLKAIDVVTSNVPGAPFPVFASGALVERMIGFGPLSGAALNVTLFSYDGICQIGIASDRAAVRDPGTLVRCLEEGIGEVVAVC